ncbi:MAG: VanZ family protein, partial [Bacteroidales bacterium]|nr:VanZ family protein [Bacteroidales bacterium]
MTPFLMLQNYLQDAIGKLSGFSFPIGNHDFPFILLLAVLLAIPGIFYLIKNYSHKRLLGIALVTILLIIAYNTSDYYFNHHFYDLQHNWHYIAYGLFSWLAWRHFSSKGLSAGKIILRTFLMAFSMSLFDELTQVFISDRVFDLSDVAKDLWGCITGLAFINFVVYEFEFTNFKKFWPQDKKHFSEFPAWILSLEFIFTIIFLNVSSILSDAIYVREAVIFTLLIFAIIFFIFKLLSNKIARKIVIGITSLIIASIILTLTFSEAEVKLENKNLFYYKNIPIVYFDLMIYPNGMIRPVDKKT